MKRLLLTILLLSAAASLSAQTLQMKVNVNKPGAEIQPTMYGIFIEDINFAADGGLYAELVKNLRFRSTRRMQDSACKPRNEPL